VSLIVSEDTPRLPACRASSRGLNKTGQEYYLNATIITKYETAHKGARFVKDYTSVPQDHINLRKHPVSMRI